MTDGIQRAMTRKARAAFEFYAVTQEGANAGASLRAFDNWLDSVKASALREAAEGFRRAAASGVEPVLNLTAARLLTQRAEKVEAGERGYSILSLLTIELEGRESR